MKLGHAFLAIAAVVLLATGARADSIPASSYDINGNLTLGNGTFNETIYFAFTLDYFTIPSPGGGIYGYYATIPSPVLVAASGPLGLFGGGSQIMDGPEGFIEFVNSASPSGSSDEIDLSMNNLEQNGSPTYLPAGEPFSGPPTLAYSSFYRCDTAACVADFLPPGSEGGVFPLGIGGESGTTQFTATSIPVDPPTNTPEPPMILLSAIGLLGLAGVAWHQNRHTHLVPKSVS